jgi:hypothetical protein
MLRVPPSPDSRVTVTFLDRQLARDNLFVQFKLGRMLLQGQLYSPNTDMGYRVLSGLAERRYGPACWLLAADFYRGAYGLPVRKDLAVYFMKKGRPPRQIERQLRSNPADIVVLDVTRLRQRQEGPQCTDR